MSPRPAHQTADRRVDRPLLAKSRHREHGDLSLFQHCSDTEDAAVALFAHDRPWGRNFCQFFGLVEPSQRRQFLLNLCIASLFHDLGKANQDFQAAVQPGKFQVQSIRHEHLSALILCLDSVRTWLANNPALDPDVITAAVLSHHLKAAQSGDDYRWCWPRGKPVLDLYLSHPQITALFECIRSAADLPHSPPLPRDRWSRRPPWQTALERGKRQARAFGRAVKADPARQALLLAVKAGVIAADSAASGLFRTGQSIPRWIEPIACRPTLQPGDLERDIIAPRCQALAGDPARPFRLKPFQERAAQLGPRALLLAGCGSGKTLAAYKWAQAQLVSRDLGHVVFLYPTRGTATEGFRDYVAWAPESDATLLHGTAEYELDGMHDNPSEAMGARSFQPGETEQRLFALGLWPRRYFSATVDQFLSFLEHRYESLCLLPLLADSAVILDEVHSYDRSMFQNLVAFLRNFDLPVLCMTATLPPSRRQALMDAGLRVYPGDAERIELRSLEDAENHPRYTIEAFESIESIATGESIDRALSPAASHSPSGSASGLDALISRVLTAYRDGMRVLWVVNTVARCQTLARQLSDSLGQPVLAYHSRYRLKDRQTQHAATVAAFQQRERAALAVTTQVCEMSLDLDADVLLTEAAPIPSLVQRLGRANRHAVPGSRFRARIYIYPPQNHLPYQKRDLDATTAFLAEVGRGDISQRTLAEALERHAPREPEPDHSARFIGSGYFAIPGSFRDEDDFSAQCILDSDLEKIARHAGDAIARKRALTRLGLPVPRRHILADFTKPEWLPPYLEIAPGHCYDPSLGFVTGEPS